MAKILFYKMLRDMRASGAAYLLCTLIVAQGLMGYSVLALCYDNLSLSSDLFFRQSEYCDGIADTADASLDAAGRLEDIRGIAFASGRLVKDVQVIGWEGEPQLHLVSWSQGEMNRPVLSRGTYPRDRRNEIVIGEGMAGARNLMPGDSVEIGAAGRRITMTITGIGKTPENIYMIRDMNQLFPDTYLYDAAFTSYSAMSQLLGKVNGANSFLIRLDSGTAWEDVEDQVEQALIPYGLISHYPGEDQQGAAMVGEEIKQLEQMAQVIPFLFLLVAAVELYITLSRMVEQQRTQIGTMMALGISRRKLQAHYMACGGLAGLAGGFGGTALGYVLADPMADYYRLYFSLPSVNAPFPVRYIAVGTAGSLLFCAGVSWAAAGALGKMEPAIALRPASPGRGKPSVLEAIPGMRRVLTVPGLMAVRSLSRNKRRTALSLAGMSVAFMITATLVSMNAMMDVFLFDYWEKTQRQDMAVYFDVPVKEKDALEAVRHSGVTVSEGILEFPVTMEGPEGTMDCRIQAIEKDSVLTKLYRKDDSRVRVEDRGVVLSEHMAQVMGLKRGDMVKVKVTFPEEKNARVPVSDVIAQYMGTAAYMSGEGAEEVTRDRNACSGVYLRGSEEALEDIRQRLRGKGNVSLIQTRGEQLSRYREMMGSISGIMGSLSAIGAGISFAVIYVSSLIRFEEMKRELSALMLLGLDSRECLDVLSVSQWILAAGAVLLGIPMAWAAGGLLTRSISSDMFTLPSMLDGGAVAGAVLLTAGAVMLGSAVMHRKLKKIMPVDFLRERE